jgi:hypothetical protein
MTTTDVDSYGERRKGGGLFWFWLPILFIVIAGGALAATALYHEPDLTVFEALGVGFGAVAAIVAGLFVAGFGLIIGFFGALVGVVTAGGALAVTAFLLLSPIIAIVLIVMLMRRRPSSECPDPDAHR